MVRQCVVATGKQCEHAPIGGSLLYLKQPESRANGRPHSVSCRPGRERGRQGRWQI